MKSPRPIGVYIHIPFCISKCPYCDFNSVESDFIPEDRYASALSAELSSYVDDGLDGRPLKSIYIGGGTPSLFSPESIGIIIGDITARIESSSETEVTLEANPSSVDFEKLNGYRKAGVNRISLGVQSFDDSVLSTLGRIHNGEDALRAFELARAAGFDSIGVDLIYGAQGQTTEGFARDLERAIKLAPEHISVYGLTYEEGTPYSASLKKGLISKLSDEDEVERYTLAVRFLKQKGYEHYEISNFALPGLCAVHNSSYWDSSDYLGLGAGAHSFLLGPQGVPSRRWWNVSDTVEYMELCEKTGKAVSDSEILTEENVRLEALYLGLRVMRGIDIRSFKERFGVAPLELLRPSARGFVEEIDGRLRLTFEGILLFDELF